MSKIKEKIWGLRKKEVDEYIKKISKSQESELKDLTEKLEVYQWENGILSQELKALTETKASFPSEALLELGLDRVEKVTEFIEQDVDMEVLAIEKITHHKVLDLENQLKEIEHEIDKQKEVIENELKSVVKIARGPEQSKNVNIEVYKNIGEKLPISDWSKTEREEQLSLDQEFWEEAPETANPNVAVPEIAVTNEEETISSGQSQAEVREEIAAVRDKFMVGRVTGEDIKDNDEQVIIPKNEPITVSVIQRAQKVGKLADLIVHMKLPGQDE